MIHLLWPSLIFPVISIGSSVLGQPFCDGGYCISVSDEKFTAESGLCVVIPCSFQTPYNFNLQHLVWFKCESDKRCGDSNIIFHTNKNKKKNIKSELLGRVSLLDPEVKNKNCSILISDLRESDSGFYQIRVIRKIKGSPDVFTFNKRTQVNVGGKTNYNRTNIKLVEKQKPTVTLPDLTVGHQATLTCTAPALCSKSPPGITWMWRGAAENDPVINGTITAFKKESLTAVTQRHHSTLTFIPTTEHHNSKITCKIQFSNDTITEKTVNLHILSLSISITYFKLQTCLRQCLRVIVKEGEVLNLTCSVDSFPPAVWTGLWSNLHNGSDHNGSATLIVTNVTAEDSGRYFCAANHQNWTETVHVDVTVMLEGSACVRRSDVLTCTCIGTGFPLPNIKWAQLSPPIEYWLTTNVSGHTVRSSLTLNKQDNVLKLGHLKNNKLRFLFSLFSQIHDGLTVAEDPNCLPEGAENEAVSTGEAAPKLRSGSGDVEYASIDFSLLKRRERTQELQTAATEYAEVKVKKEGKHAAGEEEAMMEEDDKTLLCVSKKKDEEEEAVYSSVNDLMDEI
uniref:Ig-like domain-containing protein n=1 Tax=Oryzias latipes TaxID=8090 RepID=A0A3P9MH35_ORYLA